MSKKFCVGIGNDYQCIVQFSTKDKDLKHYFINIKFHEWKVRKKAFPVFILITHEDKKIKSFSAFMNLGKQKRPSGMPPGLFCFPTGMQKCPCAVW